ncbi:MAG: DUF1002 domain-containing protein [Bacillota bacterium]|nr:DUF1002 domain-containing protein [Bacillota bacterium]
MKNIFKKRLAALIAVIFAVTTMMPAAQAFAAEGDEYLSLGADLSSSEQSTVLELLGVSNINDYNVRYVTNNEEREYLGSYVSSSEIGTRALSSVLIRENGGSDINVETHNIGYCTEGMYKNALATAGVQGADVIVAGPFEISGTAALVGTIKAYEEMTGQPVSDEVIEGSVDELTTTGEIAEEIGDTDAAEGIIAKVKEEMADNPDMTDSEMEESIRDAAEEAGVTISDETIAKIIRMLKNLQSLDIDWGNVQRQSQYILENLKDIFSSGEAQGIFARLIEWIRNLF